jgi:O-6-methylguanine DNA methyltransferase
MIWLSLTTSEGEFTAGYSAKGLSELRFPSSRAEAVTNEKEIPVAVRSWHRLTTAAVKAVLAGRAPAELPPLDLSHGTEFQQSVWAEMRKIKLGRTQSYGELARAIGNPKAVRAVGGACGANPIPLLVPCHRVLAAQQKIGGFSGGLEWKRKLLAIENVRVTQ